MSDYVKRSAVVKFLESSPPGVFGFIAASSVDDPEVIPSEDVAPVKRGIWEVTSSHRWERDQYDQINEWAWDHEFHNGVRCDICGRTVCVGCSPDYDNLTDCTPHYICSECGAVELKEYPFCHCGARMTSECLASLIHRGDVS